MRYMLSKSKLRMVELVDFLYPQHDWLTIKEIADHFGCSERTIKKDLALIRNESQEIYTESSSEGIRLHVAENHGIESFYRQIFANDYVYTLLEYLLIHGETTIEKLSEDLFISVPTLYRLTHQANETLSRNFEVKIQTSPFSLVGNEKTIRFIIAQYYTEAYPSYQWPFEYLDEHFLEEFLIFLSHHCQIKLTFADLRALKLSTAVYLYRHFDQHIANWHIDQDKSDDYYHSLMMDYRFRNLQAEFEQRYQITFNQKTFEDLFGPYLNPLYFLSFRDWQQERKYSPLAEKSYQFLSHWLTDLARQFEIPLENKDLIMLKLHNTLQTEGIETRAIFLMSNRKQQFCQLIKDKDLEFYHKVHQGILEYRQLFHKNDNIQIVYHMIYLVYITWTNLFTHLANRKKPINALILSDFDQGHTLLIQNIIYHHFANRLVTHAYQSLDIKESILQEYDIIIANFHIPHTNHPRIICVDCVPTKSDLVWVNQMIEQVHEERDRNVKAQNFLHIIE